MKKLNCLNSLLTLHGPPVMTCEPGRSCDSLTRSVGAGWHVNCLSGLLGDRSCVRVYLYVFVLVCRVNSPEAPDMGKVDHVPSVHVKRNRMEIFTLCLRPSKK